jgi:hypothetical protein
MCIFNNNTGIIHFNKTTMGFDDLFENHGNRSKYSHYDEPGHDGNKRYGYDNHRSHHGSVQSYYLSYFLGKIKNNRRLKIWIGIAAILLFVIILALLIILIPLIVKLVNFISQHGIQGVVDNISGFLEKIWKGAGK